MTREEIINKYYGERITLSEFNTIKEHPCVEEIEKSFIVKDAYFVDFDNNMSIFVYVDGEEDGLKYTE